MKVNLYNREYGIHCFIKECEIEGTFKEYVNKLKCKGDDYLININEEKLLNALPNNFLPNKPDKILVTVDKDDISLGVFNLKIFRSWSKYFTSYSIALVEKS